MVKSGWSVSIPIIVAVLLLLCQCGNGTGDDGGIIDKGSGNKRNQPFTVKIPTLTTPAASTSVNVVSLNNSYKNNTITSATATITTTTTLPIPVTTSSVLTSTRQHISSNIASTDITVRATSKATTVSSTSDSSKSNSLTTVVSESKLSSQSNGSGRPFELRGTQLKNDNETVTKALQSTQQPLQSTSTVTSTESPTNPSTKFPPTSSSAFTASTSIHHPNDFATSIKSQQQQQQQQHLQQRSKLWAPHSNVADFLKGMDDDGGSTTNSSESHYSKSGSSSHKSNTNLPSEKVGQQTRSIRSIRLIANNNSSTSASTSTGTINNNNIPAKNFISSSYRHHHNRQESQQARGENDAATFRYDDNVEKGSIVDGDDHDEDRDDDDENNVAVFHVNNKFPVISSIRHYRSRKSFSRTRKSTNPNGVGTTDVYMNRDGSASQHHHDDRSGSGRATTDGVPRNKFNYDSVTIAKNQQSRYISGGGSSKRHPGKTSQGFGNRLSYSMEAMENGGNNENNKGQSDADDHNENAEDSMELEGVVNNDMYEMPQGDASHPHTEQEKEGGETVGSRYYYGQVATRKMHEHAGNDDEGIFRAGSAAATSSAGSSSAVGVSSQRGRTEHYGKIIDKPMLLRGEGHIIAATKEGQKSGYSSLDDNTPAAVYENSYFIPKDVSSSLASTETTGGGGRGEGVQAGSGMRRRPSQLLSATTTKNGNGLLVDEQPPRHLSSAEEKNSTILHRINKTFLSRSSKSRQQKQQHLDETGSEGNEKHASPSILNADLLVNKASDLNHWQTISPEGRSRGGGSSGSNILTESEMGWEKGISADGYDTKGASRRPASGTSSDSSKGINNYFSQSFSPRKSTANDGSEVTPINTSNSQRNGEPALRETNGNMFRDKWKGTLNDSDYAIAESGKTHSLQEALQASLSSSNEKTAGVSPTKKQQRNRNGQSKQERRKQRQQSKSSRRPASAIADVPNDPRYENGSGPLSESNNFHESQGLNLEHSPDLSLSPGMKGKDIKRPYHSKYNDEDGSGSTNDQEFPYGSHTSTKEGHSTVQIQQNGQRVFSVGSRSVLQEQITRENSLSADAADRRDTSNKRKQLDKLDSQLDNQRNIISTATTSASSSNRNSDKIKRTQEMRSEGKRDNEELNKGKKSANPIEYFPKVETFSSDSAYGDSSNDNLFDEYRPQGPEYYGGDSGDVAVYEGEENASPLSGSEISPSPSSSSASSSSNGVQRNKPDSDIVTRFLNIVESQHLLGENCSAGTDFNLGEGVVDRYAQERFRLVAEFAVNRANMLTRMWKYVNQTVLHNEYLLHAMVMSMVEFDDDIFAAGNCYDQLQYKNYTLFCPFAFRYDGGSVLVKDLSIEYHYLGNSSEWFFIARKNAEKIVQAYNQFNRGNPLVPVRSRGRSQEEP